MSDRMTALLRTLVPSAWGALVTWLLGLATYPEWTAPLTDALQSDGAQVAVTAIVIGAWYALARWLESKDWFPDWLTRIVLGSSAEPVYLRGTVTRTP